MVGQVLVALAVLLVVIVTPFVFLLGHLSVEILMYHFMWGHIVNWIICFPKIAS